MAAKPVPRRRADGTIVWRQPFRLRPGGPVTYETFTSREEAVKFGALVDRIGGQAARDVRTTSGRSSSGVPTLGAWLEQHLAALSASATPGTVAEYRRMAARTWLPRLGHLPLDVIDRPAITAWIAWQRQQETARSRVAREKAERAGVRPPPARTVSPKTIANAHGLLSSTLEAAVDAEVITRNVAKRAPLPSDAERGEMVILTDSEFVELLGATPAHWQPLVALLYSTGMRWGEATALTPADLDLDGPTPVVRITRAWKKGEVGVYSGGPKTRRGRRTVALPPQIVPDLRRLCAGKAAGDLLFTSVEGKRATSQHFNTRVWHRAVAASGLTKRPRVHDLRHTHASLMIAAGMDLLQLQHRLGHESLKTTGDTYGHLLPDAHARGSAFAAATMTGAFPEIEAVLA